MELSCPEGRSKSGKPYVPRDKALQILDGETEIVLEWMPWQPRQPRDEGTATH